MIKGNYVFRSSDGDDDDDDGKHQFFHKISDGIFFAYINHQVKTTLLPLSISLSGIGDVRRFRYSTTITGDDVHSHSVFCQAFRFLSLAFLLSRIVHTSMLTQLIKSRLLHIANNN